MKAPPDFGSSAPFSPMATVDDARDQQVTVSMSETPFIAISVSDADGDEAAISVNTVHARLIAQAILAAIDWTR